MKKGINLLIKQQSYLSLEKSFEKIKTGIVLLLLLFLVIYGIFFFLLSQQSKQINDLNLEKQSILDFLVQNKEVEAKFVYFRGKEKQLGEILQQDVNFLPYYNLLKNSLTYSTPEARLDSVVINKDKKVNFSVSFNDYGGILSFLKFAETDEFLNNFNTLVLSNFNTLTKNKTQKESYQLQLSGNFVNLQQ